VAVFTNVIEIFVFDQLGVKLIHRAVNSLDWQLKKWGS